MFCYFNRQQKTSKQPEPALSQGSKVRVRCTQCVCSGLERKMTGFHAHRHTSLLTRLRTHRLPRLVPAQHPETKAGLLSAQVHLDVLVLCS